jgi:hypothetical protein
VARTAYDARLSSNVRTAHLFRVPESAGEAVNPGSGAHLTQSIGKAASIAGVIGAGVFRLTIEAKNPETWDDMLVAGWLSLALGSAVTALFWALKRFSPGRRESGSRRGRLLGA